MQKYLKNNKGFTLVEVIVVAVIVLILAAVAIPLYQGYVEDSKQAVSDNAASAIATAYGVAIQVGATPSHTAGPLDASSGAETITFTGAVNAAGEVRNSQIILPAGLKAFVVANESVNVCGGGVTPGADTERGKQTSGGFCSGPVVFGPGTAPTTP